MSNDTGGLTLADFLLARIAEDEEHWRNGEGRYARDCQECASLSDHEPNRPTVDRMLAECEAKRQIAEEHRGEFGKTGPTVTCAAHDGRYLVEDCPTLRALASVYADHPDYREEWRP